MSNKIHPFTEKVISNALTTLLETGQLMGIANVMKYQVASIAPMPGLKYNSTIIQCMAPSSNSDQDLEEYLTGH